MRIFNTKGAIDEDRNDVATVLCACGVEHPRTTQMHKLQQAGTPAATSTLCKQHRLGPKPCHSRHLLFILRRLPPNYGLLNDSDITHILHRIEQGDAHAADQLLPLVYEELRRLAASKMARESPGQTLQPTALVHEVWLRLGGDAQPQWANRAHFFAAAAEGMRRILIDNARRKHAVRHGGALAKVSADATGFDIASPSEDDAELLLVNEALDALALHDPRKAELVKMKYFTGLTLEEAADVLDVSHRTAKRDWAYARAWLFNEVKRLRA